MSILLLAIYSTVFSGIWFVLAAVKPRYGRLIQYGGSHLSPSTASILFTAIAKTIELSFVTVFVACLGQVLSRRALINSARGVTIAEMSMRNWAIQPGFMITHYENFKYTGRTMLGAFALIGAIVSMFYTTASDAVVSPHLKFGRAKDHVLYGLVKTNYANLSHVALACPGPVPDAMDPVNQDDTCLQIRHAGQAYHNYLTFLANWTIINGNGNGTGTSTRLAERPQIMGLVFDNTSVTGAWVETPSSDMPANYKRWKRVINNVTMSFPHSNVLRAARDKKNRAVIIQPEELEGIGKYKVRAAVVSPTVNVMCVNMMKTELDPLVYINWPNATTTTSSHGLPGQILAGPHYLAEMDEAREANPFLNSTPVDDIFEWGEKYGRPRAAFPQVRRASELQFWVLRDAVSPRF